MSSPTAAAQCCPSGSWGAPLNPSGPPTAHRGSDLTIGSRDTPVYYVSSTVPNTNDGSPSTRGIIVYSDVWGLSDRLKSIADAFSSQGYHVIVPDCFRGETLATNPDTATWLAKYPYDPNVAGDTNACIDHLVANGVDRSTIGALGFCWGAWAIAKASSCRLPLKCGVGAHPSTGIEKRVFGGDEDAMVEGVDIPMLLLPAGNDDERLKRGGSLATCLENKGGTSVEFPAMKHGWVTRGDNNIAEVRRDAELALTMALDFFKKHL